MNRPGSRRQPRDGFSLIEVLIATALTLILMGAVVNIFGRMTDRISDSRSVLEMADKLRTVSNLLQRDLEGLTCRPIPPLDPAKGEGYLEIVEGPVGVVPGLTVGWDSDQGTVDNNMLDNDDILLFTSRSPAAPFIGRFAGNRTITSDVAEIAWFVRGRTLYRRVLLVAPGALANTSLSPAGYYMNFDVSARVGTSGVTLGKMVGNTLGDLTKRENRFAHSRNWPYDVRGWGQLGLPTLRETASSNWNAGLMEPSTYGPPFISRIDYWRNWWQTPNSFTAQGQQVEAETGTMQQFVQNSRVAEDVVLNNVIGFDVKVWDPGFLVSGNQVGAYRDLGYTNSAYSANYNYRAYPGAPAPVFWHLGNPQSGLSAAANGSRVYDTCSTHYETEGRYGTAANDSAAGQSTNGFDDDGNGVIDDPAEQIAPPPYAAPLRGISVTIRVFEPDSRQIREVTIVQDFLPK